jgi:hypothetical protein
MEQVRRDLCQEGQVAQPLRGISGVDVGAAIRADDDTRRFRCPDPR